MIKEEDLPEGWDLIELKNLIELRKGTKSNIVDCPSKNSKPYLVIGNLRGEPINNFTDDNHGVESISDDILIVWDGANCGTVGAGLSGFVGSTIARMRITNQKVLRDYLHFYLKSLFWYFNTYTTGSTIPHLDKKRLVNLKIPLPPLGIQKKIVSILEKAEHAKQMRKEADELTRDYLNSAFLEVFGDPAYNPKDFDIVKLETLMTKDKSGTKCGPFGSALKKNEYTEDGVPVWTMDNIGENEFIEERSLHISIEKYRDLEPYSVTNGDIIISRAGTVGKMCVVSTAIHPSIISTNLIRLSLDNSKIEPLFFTFLMTFFKGRVRRLRTGGDGAYTFMNTGILKELRLPLPPISLQRQFVDIFAKTKELKEYQLYSHQKLDDLFNSSMQRAFKGELAC